MSGCKKPYLAPAITAPNSYLVVAGVINNGADSTVIKLSKTVNLGAKTTANPVSGAVVTVEGDQNTTYALTPATGGNYVTGGLSLDAAHKYRLRIKTADNKEYLSDFVPVLNSPPIDTVSFAAQGDGLAVNLGTHDPKNSTRHYRWSYEETWVFYSNYFSGYKSTGDTVIERTFGADQIHQCWGNDTSSAILLGSTANLSQDIVSNTPITFVSSTSEKFTSEYSIIVRQYALTPDAYIFWQNLKKNTEQLGSIFDPQPSQINGNIHCVSNPSEPVIGYISVGTVAAKRIFITSSQLPGWAPAPVYTNCTLDSIYLYYKPPGATVGVNEENEYFNYHYKAGFKELLIPVGAILVIPPIGPEYISGHSGSTPECVDCTLRGTNKKPVFWK